MAFYYSKRKLRPSEEEHAGELNIVPYLDILMNLILFMLLSMTGLAAFGILNVNAPNYGGGVPAGGQGDEKPPLLLTVAIGAKGFTVAAVGGVLGGEQKPAEAPQAGGEPTIPKKADGTYDYTALNDKMKEIKSAFPNETKVIVAAENDIPYEALIGTMDALRETMGPDKRLLFPDVTLGAF